ncbi:MAG TPA: hypothetical protein VGS19_21290 [Streptosporangiaceae bacterium]|nr:hypothetical protein [Streptosporangiaceae bacterium]
MNEPAAGPSDPGSVVMELGADTGALVLYTPAGLNGREIEVSRDEQPGATRTHSQVRPRHMTTVTKYAAVYPSLRAGQYTIWGDQQSPVATATITGGQVTSCRWPDS